MDSRREAADFIYQLPLTNYLFYRSFPTKNATRGFRCGVEEAVAQRVRWRKSRAQWQLRKERAVCAWAYFRPLPADNFLKRKICKRTILYGSLYKAIQRMIGSIPYVWSKVKQTVSILYISDFCGIYRRGKVPKFRATPRVRGNGYRFLADSGIIYLSSPGRLVK